MINRNSEWIGRRMISASVYFLHDKVKLLKARERRQFHCGAPELQLNFELIHDLSEEMTNY